MREERADRLPRALGVRRALRRRSGGFHLLVLVVRAVPGLVRDDKAPWSKLAGKNGEPAAGPVRPDDAADRRAGDRLSVLRAHHL
jgi:hypothetical protein